jgi:hypothetical protein
MTTKTLFVNDLAADISYGPYHSQHTARAAARRLLLMDLVRLPAAQVWALSSRGLDAMMREQLVSITRAPVSSVERRRV